MDASPTTDQTTVRSSWRALVAAIATISSVGVAIGLGIPLLSVILESRGHSATMIGLNAAVAGIASIVAAPFAAPIAARFGVVPTLLGMLLIGGFSFVGFHIFTEFWMWVVLRIFLHFALTMLFILSEYWINAAAPPEKRGLVLGIYATVLSVGFALGPWLFSRIGSVGIMPFAVGFGIIIFAMLPVLFAWKESPDFHEEEHVPFAPFIWAVPTATAAVFVFGAVETGGFALFPVFGSRVGYSEANAALLLTTIGLGNVLLQIPIGLLSDHVNDRRKILLVCALIGLAGMCVLPFIYSNWYLVAGLLFVWGGVVAGLYTVGLAHLGSQLTGRELASANAAFVFCYAVGMLVGPQAVGIGMDMMGPAGFAVALAIFFAAYALLVGSRLISRRG
ncbi:MFS transporter [Phyllobacterium bourgognense]|uniref:Putative MFS family arabinose efflux permease n=1 Tax=Phyllobacterium bourgognense TaxID=314236 RepID=A0A368Z204_9HYPH|nr:MFS transporter [Phyllobacterium bourgognense]RCW85486.1 putative MFS family arabinose efflux permease [Phyllobacterium bourgognense]